MSHFGQNKWQCHISVQFRSSYPFVDILIDENDLFLKLVYITVEELQKETSYYERTYHIWW